MKKGQAALEFLMTYGWAILVVLIVIGALAYFGVFNPTNLIPERCTLQQGLTCADIKLSDTGNIAITLQNGMGTGILLRNFTMNSTGPPQVGCNLSFPGQTFGTETNVLYIPNGQATTLQVPVTTGGCNPVSSLNAMKNTKRKYKFELNLIWFREDSSSQFAHTMTGEVLARVE